MFNQEPRYNSRWKRLKWRKEKIEEAVGRDLGPPRASPAAWWGWPMGAARAAGAGALRKPRTGRLTDDESHVRTFPETFLVRFATQTAWSDR